MNAAFLHTVPLRRMRLDELQPEPWRNGAGTTRTIAAEAAWRISVADIEEDCVFSIFDGIDRSAALLSGAGLSLVWQGGTFAFARPGDIVTFDGECPLTANPASPARLVNVMCRRGQATASVTTHAGSGTLPDRDAHHHLLLPIDGDVMLTLCHRGHYTAPLVLRTNECLLASGPLDAVQFENRTVTGRLIHAAIFVARHARE